MKKFNIIIALLFSAFFASGQAYTFDRDSCVLHLLESGDTLGSYDLRSLVYGQSTSSAFYWKDASNQAGAAEIAEFAAFANVSDAFIYLDGEINACLALESGIQTLAIDSNATTYNLSISDGNTVQFAKGGGGGAYQVWDTLQSGSDELFSPVLDGSGNYKFWLDHDTLQGLNIRNVSDGFYVYDGGSPRAIITSAGITSYGTSNGFSSSGTTTYDFTNTSNNLDIKISTSANDSLKFDQNGIGNVGWIDEFGWWTINNLNNFTESGTAPLTILSNGTTLMSLKNGDDGNQFMDFRQNSTAVGYFGAYASDGALHLSKDFDAADGLSVDDNQVIIHDELAVQGTASGGAGNNAIGDQVTVFLKTAITGGGDNVTLPTVRAGRMVYIKDAAGGATADNITVLPNSGETIDGGASFVIRFDDDGFLFWCDGTNWWILNRN